jgi:hypothetical protein
MLVVGGAEVVVVDGATVVVVVDGLGVVVVGGGFGVVVVGISLVVVGGAVVVVVGAAVVVVGLASVVVVAGISAVVVGSTATKLTPPLVNIGLSRSILFPSIASAGELRSKRREEREEGKDIEKGQGQIYFGGCFAFQKKKERWLV